MMTLILVPVVLGGLLRLRKAMFLRSQKGGARQLMLVVFGVKVCMFSVKDGSRDLAILVVIVFAHVQEPAVEGGHNADAQILAVLSAAMFVQVGSRSMFAANETCQRAVLENKLILVSTGHYR